MSPTLPHGYADSPVVEHEAHIHPELRSIHKEAAKNGHAPTPNMMPAGMPQSEQAGSIPGPSHMSAGGPNMGPADMGDVVMADGRRAKRELSQSKRAAQNRAAQVSQALYFYFGPLQMPIRPPTCTRIIPKATSYSVLPQMRMRRVVCLADMASDFNH